MPTVSESIARTVSIMEMYEKKGNDDDNFEHQKSLMQS
jgi:hypothetical protein